MLDRGINRIEASFSLGNNESTKLVVESPVLYGFKATASYSSKQRAMFPSNETAERSGSVDNDLVESLAHQILTICDQNWFHRYTTRQAALAHYDCLRWKVAVERDGKRRAQWEGCDKVPQGMLALYDSLTAFGMYGLRGFASYTHGRELDGTCDESFSYGLKDEFGHILCYEKLFDEVLSAENDPGEQGLWLVDDFCDDVRLYLRHQRPRALEQDEKRPSYYRERIDDICATGVGGATREEMLDLLGRLMRVWEPQTAITEFVSNGTFARWCERLRRIPREEYEERERAREQERANRAKRIDDAIRSRMEMNRPFTSYDVAEDCDITAQQASVRIRSFVRKGVLLALEGDLPRQYQAAA